MTQQRLQRRIQIQEERDNLELLKIQIFKEELQKKAAATRFGESRKNAKNRR